MVYTFLTDDAQEDVRLDCRQLDLGARSLAARLQGLGVSRAAEPPRALVVFPPGLGFLTGLFGAIYAGAIAVPTRYPHPRRPLDHLAGIVEDCGAAFGITTAEMHPILAAALPGMHWLTLDADSSGVDQWQDPNSTADAIAYLQYTSGSTSRPKGVVLPHRQVLANCEMLRRHFRIGPESRILSWLPHFHDMGLVFGLLEAIYAGCRSVNMSPMDFAQRPLTWLEAVTRFRITHTAAPNFAYQTCADLPADRLAGLDLSSLEVAINGAEHVRSTTIQRFTERFARSGFSPAALCPGYGLAENTLIATASRPGALPVLCTVRAEALKQGRFEPVRDGEQGVTLASSGDVHAETRVLIVDPVTRAPLSEDVTGEIWLSGPSVAQGYWSRPQTSYKFNGFLAPSGDGPFLRTGDLGVIHAGEIFIRGRLDDLVVVRGHNCYPEDLEPHIEASHPALEPNGCAVFGFELGEEQRLGVAAEVRRTAVRGVDADALVRAIVAAVSEAHQLEISAVVLLRPRTLPRTRSGKRQRGECRRRFLDRSLDAIETWIAPRLRATWDDALSPAGATQDKAAEAIQWLRSYAEQRINSRLMDERRSMPPYITLDLGARGLLGVLAPERYGGLGLDNLGFGRILQQVAAIDLSLGIFVLLNNVLGIRPILRHATPARREELLPILASGRQLASFAVTEPGAGTNLPALSSRAEPDGQGGYRLWGTKIWSGTSAWAGVVNTFVQLRGAGPGTPAGLTGFIVRQGAPGLRMGAEALTLGLRAMVQNEVHLDGVPVTREDVLGEPGQGNLVLMDTLRYGRLGLAWVCVGAIKRCLQLMVRHATRRTVTTGRLLDNAVTLIRISDLSAAAAAVEALVTVVARLLDSGVPVPEEIYCACKCAGPDLAWRAADQLVQQMGGRGYIETNIAPQMLRDARIFRIFEGATEPMAIHIGSRFLQDPQQIRSFFSDTLQQPSIAAELESAAARIAERCLGATLPAAISRTARQSWASLLTGEVATYGILLAAVAYQCATAPTEELRRAERWARLRMERKLAKALTGNPAEAVCLPAVELERIVAGYESSIGDIEQQMAGEDHQLDPLIRRAFTPAPEQQPSPPPPPNPSAHESAVPSDDHILWLTQWVASHFKRDPQSVRPSDRFAEYGFDSVTAFQLTDALEKHFGVQLSPSAIWDYPTFEKLAAHLASLERPHAAGPANVSSHGDELALLAQLDRLSDDEIERLLQQIPAGGTP